MADTADQALSKRTIRAVFWTVGARLLSRVLDFATLLVLARFLGPEDFGLVATAMTIILVLEAILELPLSSVLVRLPEITDRACNTAFTLGLLRGLVLTAIIVVLSYPLAAFYGDQRLVALICTLALAPALRGMISPRMAVFEKALNFRPRGIVELSGKVAATAVAIAVAITLESYWAIAASTLTAPAIMALSSYLIAPMRPQLTTKDWPLFSEMISWNLVSQTLTAINWQIDRFLLPRYVDTSSFGRYTAANDLASLPAQALVAPATGPLISAFVAAREENHLKETYLKASAGFTTLLLPVFFFIALCPELIIQLLLGPKWSAAAPILSGLAWTSVFVIPSIPMLPLALSMNRSRDLAARSFVELSIRVPLSLIGIIMFGIPGAIVARGGSFLAVCLSSVTLIRSMAGATLREQFGVLMRPAAALVPACAFVLACKHYAGFDDPLHLEFLATGALFCIIYAVALGAAWLVTGRPDGIEEAAFRMVTHYIHKR